jgi:hypothetical protein
VKQTPGYSDCNLFIKLLLPADFGVWKLSSLTAEAVLSEGHGNLYQRLVSNAVRTRATSHPCERGAGLLEI